MQVSFVGALVLAFEDVANPSILYAILLPVLVWGGRSFPAFCAGASGLAASLLLVCVLPGFVESLPVALLAALVLLGLCLMHLREVRQARTGASEADLVLAVFACISFLFSLITSVFALVTGNAVGGVRPGLAAIAILLACRWLNPLFKDRRGMRVARTIALVGVVLLCGRGMVWYGQFHTVSSSLTRPVWAHANIERLYAAQDGLLHLKNDRLGEAVESFRTALLGSEPETIPFRVAHWTGLQRDSLPIMLAFGGKVPLKRGIAPVSFSWDRSNQRLLVLGENGDLIAVTLTGVSDLGTPLADAVSVAASRDGSQIGLLSAQGRVFVTDRDGNESWKLWLPKNTYRDLAQTELPDRFLALRADGGTFNVTNQGSRLLTGYDTWPDTQPAVSIVATPDGTGHYALTRFGGVHPRGETLIGYDHLKEHAKTQHFWEGRDLARAIDVFETDSYPIYLDSYGGLHAVIKISDKADIRGNDYPPLPDPDAVDLIAGIIPRMIYILCEDGTIVPVPDRGWLFPSGERS
ncbi:MAG: hypothetical protein ABIH23_22760 [bacterium]